MRLGFIVEPQAPNSNYRAIFPMRALEALGHEVLWPAQLERDLAMADLLTCDLVHCFRRPDRTRDLKQLAQRGIAISFDNDDDFSVADMTTGASGRLRAGGSARLGNARRSTELLRLAKLADLTTTPSYVLAERYRSAGVGPVSVIENHLDGELEGFGRGAAHEGVVIGWMAGAEHQRDLALLDILDVLEGLLDAHPELRIVTVGLRLPLRSPRYEFRPKVPFGELLPAIADFDIGIAPLADTPFNRARSDIKLKEYAAVGATWLASPVGAYRDVGSGQGGRLVGEDRWYDVLHGLIGSRFKRQRLSRQALKWARSQTIDRFASQWENEFTLAIERARERQLAAASTAPARVS